MKSKEEVVEEIYNEIEKKGLKKRILDLIHELEFSLLICGVDSKNYDEFLECLDKQKWYWHDKGELCGIMSALVAGKLHPIDSCDKLVDYPLSKVVLGHLAGFESEYSYELINKEEMVLPQEALFKLEKDKDAWKKYISYIADYLLLDK